MRLGGRHVVVSAVSILAAGLLYRGYSLFYAQPRDEYRTLITSQQEATKAFEGDAAGIIELGERRDEVHLTMLGGRVDEVEHRFRTRLNEVALSCGIAESEIEVSSASPRAMDNPAVRGVSKAWKRLFAERTDFVVMRGGLSGVGTLDQVLRTIGTLQVQPWAHRVDSISIRPLGGGDAFDFRVGVATLIFPGEEPTELADNVALDAGAELAWAGIVQKNAFRKPDPEEPVVVVETPPDAVVTPDVAPPPPFHEWKLVGVWDGTNAMGVILANTRSGRSRLIEPGQGLLGLKLVVATGERAEFEFEGKRYELLQKQTLAERRELDQPRG